VRSRDHLGIPEKLDLLAERQGFALDDFEAEILEDRHELVFVDDAPAECATTRDVEAKVALGFVEGLNNKIRVLQRRAYGLRDEEYLRLKILTCRLPTL
jgi:Transposase